MHPNTVRACLLACALAVILPMSPAAGTLRAADGDGQAIAPPAPVTDQEWKRFTDAVAKSQLWTFAKSIDPDDPAVKKAIAAWESELKVKLDVARGDFVDLLSGSG